MGMLGVGSSGRWRSNLCILIPVNNRFHHNLHHIYCRERKSSQRNTLNLRSKKGPQTDLNADDVFR